MVVASTLDELSLPLLEAADVVSIDWAGVGAVLVPAVTTIGDLRITNTSALTVFDAPALTEVTTSLRIGDNVTLIAVSLDALAFVGENLSINYNINLPQCLVDGLGQQVQAAEGVGGNVWVWGNDESCTCPTVAGELVASCP